MKRALAERAKQSFDTLQAKQPPATDRRTPQQPPTVSGNPSTSSGSSSTAQSSMNHLPINQKIQSADPMITNAAEEERQTHESGGSAANLDASFDSTGEPPKKIPRLEKISPSSNHLNNNGASSSVPQSPRSPRNLPKKNVLGRTNSSSNFQPPTKRIFPGDAPAASSAAAEERNSKKRIKDEEEEEEDSSSAFYLKHQNRALATELKSLQFAVQQLEGERDVRRQHCHAALQAVNEIQNVWISMEKQTVGRISSSSSFAAPAPSSSQDPPSTGTGESVEWTRALQNSLVALGQGPVDSDDLTSTDVLEKVVSNIAARAKVLQEWLGTVLKSGTVPPPPQQEENGESSEQRLHNLQREMGVVTARCTELKAQVSEMAASRLEVTSRERRVRRNVYRMAAGMLSPEQVVNTLERGEEDELEVEVQLEKQQRTVKSEPAETMPPDADSNQKQADAVSSAQLEEFKSKITSLEEVVSNAESSIHELNSQLSENERRITELSKRQLSDADAAKLESLESTLLQLKTSQKSVADLQTKLAKNEEKWAQALGNEKATLAALDELIGKFNKRWAEVTDQSGSAESFADGEPGKPIDLSTNDLDRKIAATPLEPQQAAQAKQIAVLQHKLDQALENVRQSETTRENLKEAIAMNGALQSKLDEVKAKYAAVQAARSSSSTNAGSASNRPESSSAATEMSTSKEKESASSAQQSEGSSRSDKLHRDYRRARKDLAAMTASKEATKAKYERAEKERENLMESNVRLLKQIGEKDEMNAKSLSTILHLKSMTEKLTVERDTLEQQAKSASQLALAARLATNAKERVSEEVVKEKQALEERVVEIEKQYQATQSELNRISSEWSEASGRMAVKESELANALKRCDELVSENEHKREEIRKLVDVVSKAEREANEAKARLSNAVESGNIAGDMMGSGSSTAGGSFSVDQLKTQISVLKSRLTCPVCHYRDKECIILRCRHMHCKQCVDERISNRSRKCPTCNVKFSENDVGDVWL